LETLGWMTLMPSHMNHPSRIWACFPPGLTFMQLTSNASSE
jgi:hypothetical protein